MGEEEARWAVEKASERVEKGDAEGALRLLERAERLHPHAPGLPELAALAQVCHAASSSCACSAAPHWYRILMVSEKADLTAIKKRYRQLALLLHPDKNKHARAEEAFKLVSEAYGHLSDSKKRETFDVNIRKKECRKCSFQSECQPCWGNRESLQSCYFPYFHCAEWKMEHEKLQMFRERAQAKVDSLAQILKERRSRWNEELGTTKGRYKKKGYCSLDKHSHIFTQRSQRAAERKVFGSQSYEELHQWGRDKNGESKKAGGSFSNTDLSQISNDAGQFSFMEKKLFKELINWTSRDTKDPQVLQKLYGSSGIVKGEMGESVEGAEGKPGDKQQLEESRVAEGNEINDDDVCRSLKYWVKIGSNKAQFQNKLDEEWIVIDDFLAGLHEGQNFKRAEETCSLNESSMKRIGRASYSFARRSCNSIETLSDVEGCKGRPTTSLLQAHKYTLERARAPLEAQGLKLQTRPRNEMKQSEQQLLLRTLERLRDETKSIAATLESMKEARIFPGSCHVPASIIAT